MDTSFARITTVAIAIVQYVIRDLRLRVGEIKGRTMLLSYSRHLLLGLVDVEI